MEDERILVPDLLKVTQPEIDFDTRGAHKLRISYEFLPQSVIPRLIVRRHHEIESDLRWRNGVVFHNTNLGSRALIRADYENRAILAWISGGSVQQYLALLLDDFDGINRGFQENKIVAQVACICKACTDSIEPEFFPLHRLMHFYSKGHRDWPCSRSYTMISIPKLLGHSLTGDTEVMEKLFDEVIDARDELAKLKPGPLRQKIQEMASSMGITSATVTRIWELVVKSLL